MADVRIKDLAAFSGTPAATDFLAIDGPNETKKIPGNAFALNSKTDYAIKETKSTPNGTIKIVYSDIPPASIDTPTVNNEEEYFKKTIKKICETYPNRTETLFIGKGTPDSNWFYEIFIYNTSDVDANGLPRHSFGRAYKYILMTYYGGTTNYNWEWKTAKNFNMTTLISGDDLDTLHGNSKSGFYYITTNVANAPTSYAGLIVISATPTSATYQLVVSNSGIWWRSHTGSPLAWTEWKSIGNTTRQTFTGDYISGQWVVRRNGDVVTMQLGNFKNVQIPTGEFRMNGVVPEGFRPSETASYTFISRESTPRVFALSVDTSGNMVFYNYSSAYSGSSALPISAVFTYLA